MKPGSAGRLLVVTYHFPPGPGVGGLRWAGLSRHLARNGWEVRVVSAYGSGWWELAPSVQVLGCPPRSTVADRYRQWRTAKATRRAQDEGRHLDGFRPATARNSGATRKLLRSLSNLLLDWPDTGRGWIRPALTSVRNLIREFQPTAIISSGPPHSAHVVVRLARGQSDVPWYMDFRDPWNQSRKNARATRWLEKHTVRHATGMITTTNEFRAALEATHGVPAHWIPNGVDLESLPTSSEDPFPGLSVIHLGSLYLERDPAPILEAFRRFLEAFPEAEEAGSTLRFVGDGDHPWLEKVADAARDPARRVELSPPVPREEALSLLRRSSLALVLSKGQQKMVPAKLYESVALGVPTLVIGKRDSAAFREAERLGAWRATPDDVAAMVTALTAVWNGEATAPRPRADVTLDHAELAKDVSALLNEGSARTQSVPRGGVHSP